ncbi:unnamed protein product, partial [Adineta steineri]
DVSPMLSKASLAKYVKLFQARFAFGGKPFCANAYKETYLLSLVIYN